MIRGGVLFLSCMAIPLIISAWLLYSYTTRISIPHTVKLADCTNNMTAFHVMIPKGHAYHLELKVPEIQVMTDGTVTSSYKFSGRVRILNGENLVADFPIDSDKAWLTSSCFVITGVDFQNTNLPPLNQFVQAQKNYDIQITLDPPPTSSSIWLYWLQSKLDMSK